jgi:hypothetical protein
MQGIWLHQDLGLCDRRYVGGAIVPVRVILKQIAWRSFSLNYPITVYREMAERQGESELSVSRVTNVTNCPPLHNVL